MASGYRLAAGTLTKAVMDSSASTYEIENFPRQTDQIPGREWVRPNSASDAFNEAAEFVDPIGGARAGYGRRVIIWYLQGLSSDMVAYLRTTFFGGTDLYGDVTIRTWNRSTGAWEYYNGRAIWPLLSDTELALGGLHNFKLEIVKCTVAAAS